MAFSLREGFSWHFLSLTDSYGLKAKYIIHTVGPIWQGGQRGERNLLASCYATALELAASHGCRSSAFPLISAGIFGYPKAEALDVAREAAAAFLKNHDMDIYLVLYP